MIQPLHNHYRGLCRQLTHSLTLLLLASSLMYADPAEHLDEEAMDDAAYSAELSAYLSEDPEGRAVSAFIEQQMPSEVQVFFDGALQREPELAEEMLEQLAEIYAEYTELQQDVPAAAALFLKINRHEVLSQVLSESFEPQSAHAQAIAQKIRAELEAAFDLKLQWQAQEVQELEDEVEALRGLLEQRKQARAAIIQRRLDELTDINSHLEW